MKNFAVTSLLLLITVTSGAVSRIGGGKISSQSSGFTLDFDSSYKMMDISNGVRASGDNAFVPGLGMVSKFFEITEFKTEYPQYETLTREAILEELKKLGWSEIQTNYPCALGVRKSSNNVVAVIVTWGSGKGLVIKGLYTWNSDKVLSDSLKTLALTDGSCSWK